MLKIISEMITSYVAGAVLIFVGIYFKRHIYTNIGNCGISVPSAKEDMVKWMYAQAIGPKFLINNGICLLAITGLLNIATLFLDSIQNRALFISAALAFCFILGTLMAVNYEVEKFSPECLANGDHETLNNWIDNATEFAKNNQYLNLYEHVKATK